MYTQGGKRKKNDVLRPELSAEYNFICRQHNGFVTSVTLSVACSPIFPVMLFTPPRGRFCLRNNLHEAFHKY